MAIAHETFRYILFPAYMKYINTVTFELLLCDWWQSDITYERLIGSNQCQPFIMVECYFIWTFFRLLEA